MSITADSGLFSIFSIFYRIENVRNRQRKEFYTVVQKLSPFFISL